MSRSPTRAPCWLALAPALLSAPVLAAPWEDATPGTIGTTGQWSNKVRLADIDGDGDVDILLANGGGYSTPGADEANGAWLNQLVEQGPGAPYVDASAAVFGPILDNARVILARDLDGDGNLDLFVGTTWGTRSRLYLGDGGGKFSETTDEALPAVDAWVGDAEIGDVNGDGNLDLVLANWGGNPQSAKGRTLLWLGDGAGVFTDATDTHMPAVEVGWSWEIELADVDNDWDLDVLVSCKACSGSYLFENDGLGKLEDVSAARMPQLGNNYEFEAMDIDGDGSLDLVTINDHPGSRNGVFMNDGSGTFTDETDVVWPMADNPAGDDNMVAFVDVDSDGDPDLVVAGLSGSPDRLLRNQGGIFELDAAAFDPADSPGSLGIAVSDLSGDGRWDVALAEGEVAFPDKVFFGVDIPPDTAPPVIGPVGILGRTGGAAAPTAGGAPAILVRARVHDDKSPLEAHDLTEVVVRHGPTGEPTTDRPMTWMGGYLWRATVDVLPGPYTYQVCATDAAGNEGCSDPREIDVGGETTGGASGSGTSGAAGTSGGGSGSSGVAGTGDTDGGTTGADADGGGGCGCAARDPRGPGAPLALLAALAWLPLRRRPAR